MLLLALAMLVCLALKMIVRPDLSFVWSFAYIPIVLFLGLVVLQITPLPAEYVKVLSPNTLALKQQFLAASNAGDGALRKLTLSFYPYETKHSLRILVVVATVFVVVINVFRTSSQIQRLLTAVAVVGAAEALINVAQFLTGTDKVLWVVPMGHKDSGTFINHSHFGQFINLTCGAMLGLLLMRLGEVRVAGKEQGRGMRPRGQKRNFQLITLLSFSMLFALAALSISLTRGGMASAGLAGAMILIISLIYFEARGQTMVWLLSLLFCGAILAAAGFDVVFDRLATLAHVHDSIMFRPQVARDILQIAKKLPLFGSGLGTHSVFYPPFQTVFYPDTIYDADDQYVQMLEEIGVVGLLFVTIFLAYIVYAFIGNLGRRRRPIRSAAIGLGFGLIAILVHSGSDFGQRIPSIACYTAVTCGLLISITSLRFKRSSAVPPAQSLVVPKGPSALFQMLVMSTRVGALLLCLAVAGPLMVQADHARGAEQSWRVALRTDKLLRETNWQGDNQIYQSLIASADDASKHEPENIRYAYWLAVYRWQAIARLTDPATGKLINTPLVIATASHVVNDLLSLPVLCPTFSPPYAAAAQLVAHQLGHPELGAQLMQQACTLAPCDASVLLAAATMDIDARSMDRAAAELRNCLQADSDYLTPVVNLMFAQNRYDLALQVVGDKIDDQRYVLKRLNSLVAAQPPTTNPSNASPTDASGFPTAVAVRAQIIAHLREACEASDAPADALADLGAISLDEKDPVRAAEYYRRAVSRNYGQLDWRLNFARALAGIGDMDRAIAQVEACQRVAPERADIRDLLRFLYERARTTQANQPVS